MSTQLFYHLFGIKGYRVIGHRVDSGRRIVKLRPNGRLLCCSACKCPQVVHSGRVVRLLHSVPVGLRATMLEVTVPRLECRNCGLTRQLAFAFADPRASYTKAFARYVVTLARHMSLSALARLLSVGWDLIKSIVKRHLQQHYGRPRLRHVRWIAIDEINLGRRFGFSTIVLDLDSGAVIYVGEGRSAAALDPFWRRLRASRAKIEAVAMDMGAAYRSAVRRHLPNAVCVVDRFHIVKLLNDRIAQLLRGEVKRAHGPHWKILQGTRWLLTKRHDNLDEEAGEVERLQQALRINQPLMTAYYLKEYLELFWKQETKEQAAKFFDAWIKIALASGVGQLINFARSIRRFRQEMLNWYDYPISTGPLESANGRIRFIQRRACGYRDREFFTLCIYAMHDRVYA